MDHTAAVPGPCDLMRRNNEFVTVYSGHLVFQGDNATTPGFYCLDLAVETEDEVVDGPTAL